MPKFGKRSSLCLDTCHDDLQKIHREAIKDIPVDYGIHEGKRSDEKQLEYFEAGKSRIDPRIPELKQKGKHLREPSEATDFHVAEVWNGKSLAWDDTHLAFIAGYLIRTAQELFARGEISHLLRWGGDWDSDGIIALDHSLKDMPHLELYQPPTA
jgi:peptidoglycan L-alanyl-D-glutamate endopeptidase CwlK